MKHLSIKNPWAYLIVSGMKDVENRTWRTPYRGTLIIHATGEPFCWPDGSWFPESVRERLENDLSTLTPYELLSPVSRGYEDLCRYAETYLGFSEKEDPSAPISDAVFAEKLKGAIKHAEIAPFVASAIIGEAELFDIVEDSDSPWAQEGCFHWLLRNPVWYDKPELGVKGCLRLW
jgi:hypothetical protein